MLNSKYYCLNNGRFSHSTWELPVLNYEVGESRAGMQAKLHINSTLEREEHTHNLSSSLRSKTFALPCTAVNQPVYIIKRSRDSAVGIATGFGLDDRGVKVRVPVGTGGSFPEG
jgi:hypothetical protein